MTVQLAKADYGIDAPGQVAKLGLSGALCLAVFGVLCYFLPAKSRGPIYGLLWPGVLLPATAAFMWLSSRYLKFAVRDRVLAELQLSGQERVLDIGCGRGLLLIAAAKQLEAGQAVGIDIWSATDLSANSPEAVRANALAEGVAHRVTIDTGDARALPYPDASFDAVVSMTALHNIASAADRAQALTEMMRVLKPGGRLSMFDIFHPWSYAKILRAQGLALHSSRLIFLWAVPGRRHWGVKPLAGA